MQEEFDLDKIRESTLPHDQPPCGNCDFVKYNVQGFYTGEYICIHCGFRISEEEYKQPGQQQ
jgi:MoaA/NifB/PqqE/SkfB family radical SAM enzyme